MKLLIADDDAVFRTLLGNRAQRWGYEPVYATDGEESWRVIAAPDGPRVALLDWVMPKADGPEICRRVRRALLPNYVYLILLTARTASADLLAGMEAGADEFVAKPVDMEQLRLRIAAGARIVKAESRQLEGRRQTELLVDNLRGISARLFHTQEEERRTIARELHEGVAQHLSSVLMSLGLAANATNCAEALGPIGRSTQEIVARVRMLAYRLYPLLLDEIGLVPALRHYCQGVWGEAENEIELLVAEGVEGLAPEIEVAIFRIAQEATDTLRRLTGSRRAVVEVGCRDGGARLEVRSRSAARPGADLQAIGILEMRERAEQLGGRLTVAQGDGVLAIRVDLPARRDREGKEAGASADD